MVACTLDSSANASMQAGMSSPAGAVARIEMPWRDALYGQLGTPLLDVAGRHIGELRILRSSESARQRINALRRDIMVAWVIAVLGGIVADLQPRPTHPETRQGTGSRGRRGSPRQLRLQAYTAVLEDPDVGTHDELGRLAAVFNTPMCSSIFQGRAAGTNPPGTDHHHRPALHIHRA